MPQAKPRTEIDGDLVLGVPGGLPISGNGWPKRLFQIVSLLDMKPFSFERIIWIGNLWFNLTDGHFGQLSGDLELDEKQKTRIHEILEPTKNDLIYIGLEQTAKYVSNIRGHVIDRKVKTYGQYKTQIDVLHDLAINEIEGMVFGFLPRDRGPYFQQKDLFGRLVNEKFRKAIDDIKEAGNCYAFGSYTGCVFYLTRVLEHGLWTIAADTRLSITIADPRIETWETLINRIESAITKLQGAPKGGDKMEFLDVFSGAALHFRYFKDHWRNPLSHLKANYDGPQALSALGKVKEFMGYLAEKGFAE